MYPLNPLLPESVDNVYVFICDALRWDELPASVADLGVSFTTYANALCTPQSVPTMLTGRYPPGHGVNWFDQELPESVPSLLDTPDVDGGFRDIVWKGSSILDVLGRPSATRIEDLEEPFVLVEHDHGGHTPFPGHMDGSTRKNLQSIPDERELLRQYRTGVAESVDRFHDRLDLLRERGLLERTLVVFTSDHGELLGEYGGFVGHAFPAVPELVNVPTVFIHEDLPTGERRNDHVCHVDLVPTVIGLMTDVNFPMDPEPLDGYPLIGPLPEDRLSYTHAHVPAVEPFSDTFLDPIYLAPSVWHRDGGRVFVDRSIVHRLTMAGYDAFLSGYTAAFNSHRNPLSRLARTLSMYRHSERSFGTPPFSSEEAWTLVEQVRVGRVDAEQREISDETKATLEDLGYM